MSNLGAGRMTRPPEFGGLKAGFGGHCAYCTDLFDAINCRIMNSAHRFNLSLGLVFEGGAAKGLSNWPKSECSDWLQFLSGLADSYCLTTIEVVTGGETESLIQIDLQQYDVDQVAVSMLVLRNRSSFSHPRYLEKGGVGCLRALARPLISHLLSIKLTASRQRERQWPSLLQCTRLFTSIFSLDLLSLTISLGGIVSLVHNQILWSVVAAAREVALEDVLDASCVSLLRIQ